MKGDFFPLQASLISPNFPARQPPDWCVKTSLIFDTAVALQGSFWWFGRCGALQSTASRTICGWGAIRGYALRECRDSACWRPFGVRRNAAGVCSEMTQWVWRIEGYTPFVGMLLNQCHNACSAAILNHTTISDSATMPAIIKMFVPYHNVISTDLYCTIHAKISPLCHSERSGTDIENQAIKSKKCRGVEPRRGAGRRNLGTRAWGFTTVNK